jgi:hypothetical protein
MTPERHRAAVSKRMSADQIRLITSVFGQGHTHQANDHGDTLIRQQMSAVDHIQVAAARKG